MKSFAGAKDDWRRIGSCHPLTAFGVLVIFLPEQGFRRYRGSTPAYWLPPTLWAQNFVHFRLR